MTKRKWLRALHEIHETTQVFMEMSSSRSSSARMKSGVSVIARKQAKVEAARAKIKISEQERNQIKLDEDDLWASMLRHELSVVSESCDLRTHNVFT